MAEQEVLVDDIDTLDTLVSLCAQLGREIAKLLLSFAQHCQQHSTSAGATTPNNVGSCCVRLHVVTSCNGVFMLST